MDDAEAGRGAARALGYEDMVRTAGSRSDGEVPEHTDPHGSTFPTTIPEAVEERGLEQVSGLGAVSLVAFPGRGPVAS